WGHIEPTGVWGLLLQARWTEGGVKNDPDEHGVARHEGPDDEPFFPPGGAFVRCAGQASRAVDCLLGEGEGGEDVGGILVGCGSVARRIAVSDLLPGNQ